MRVTLQPRRNNRAIAGTQDPVEFACGSVRVDHFDDSGHIPRAEHRRRVAVVARGEKERRGLLHPSRDEISNRSSQPGGDRKDGRPQGLSTYRGEKCDRNVLHEVVYKLRIAEQRPPNATLAREEAIELATCSGTSA